MKELIAFNGRLYDIFGYYVQTEAGLKDWHEKLKQVSSSKNTSLSNRLFIGRGDPNDSDATYQYRSSIGEILENSSEDGKLLNTLRQSIIVMIVASWEDYFRQKMADELHIEKNDLKSDLFRDLNRCRQGIVHVDGTLDDKLLVLQYFQKGDQLNLTDDHIYEIFEKIIDELNRISKHYYHTESDFTFSQYLNR